ncbi:MAG: ATP-binding cassette domain-containing protein [Phycisphaerales bacterium]
MSGVIDLHDVAKTYRGRVRALRGVSMQVHAGEVFGLLGPNGAGKSTLVKILMTVISPTRCTGTMLGRPVGDKGALSRVGYLPEHHRFPEYLTGRQVLEFSAAMNGITRNVRRQRSGELMDLVGLSRWQDRRVGGYSKGMRQRVGIAQALMNDPDLVLLDEPTDGVDPVGRRDIRAILIEQRRRGKTVFLNSHLLSELEMVCDRVAIMVQGAVTSQGTLGELTAYGRRYEIETMRAGTGGAGAGHGAAGGPLEDETVIAALRGLVNVREESGLPERAWEPAEPNRAVRIGVMPGGERVEIGRGMIRVGTDDAGAVQEVIDAVRRAGLVLRSARPVRPTLEDLFMRAVVDPVSGAALEPGAAPAEPKQRSAT